MTAHLVQLLELFVRTSFGAFGGGVAVIPEIQRVAVGQQHWLTAQQFADSYALGQLTPGPGMLMVMAIGYSVEGVPGAIVSMAAMFVPVGIVAYIAGSRWHAVRASGWRTAVQAALIPVTVGLLLAGSYTLLSSAVSDAPTALIAVAATGLLLSKKVSPALIVIAGGIAGFLAYR